MLIGDKLRAIREAKKLSQGDVEHRTGLLRAYVSRVENGHTVPGCRDAGEVCAGAGSADVPAVLRGQRGAKAGFEGSPEASCLGRYWERGARAGTIPKAAVQDGRSAARATAISSPAPCPASPCIVGQPQAS